MHLYAQIESLEQRGLPGICLWSHCTLFLREPANPPQTYDQLNPDDCIGVVWLHNPAIQNRPRDLPPVWGRINVRERRRDTLAVIRLVMESLADNLPDTPEIPQFPYVALEELVYLDSIGVRELWTEVTHPNIQRYSILNTPTPGCPRLAYPRSKFVWLAWGQKPRRVTNDYPLPIRLMATARGAARRSGRPLVGLGRQWNARPQRYAVYRYTPSTQAWTRHCDRAQTQAEPPDEYGHEFPLHPFDLGRFLQNPDDPTRLPLLEDLVEALLLTVTT